VTLTGRDESSVLPCTDMLNADQQKLVEDNIDVAEKAVKHLVRSLPHLRTVVKNIDLHSAAMVGMCKAARTFDPKKSNNVAGYMYWAARNAASTELVNEMKFAEKRKTLNVYNSSTLYNESSRALECLQSMTEMERDWLEKWCLYGSQAGGGYAALVRENKLGIKKVKRMLNEMIEKFESMYQDFPDTK